MACLKGLNFNINIKINNMTTPTTWMVVREIQFQYITIAICDPVDLIMLEACNNLIPTKRKFQWIDIHWNTFKNIQWVVAQSNLLDYSDFGKLF